MAERIDKTILSFELDAGAARKAQQGVSNISKEYERLKQQAAGLQEQFRTQGQAANYVAAQIAILEDAYRRGEISQQEYVAQSRALAAEQQTLDAAFASTIQSLSQTDNSVKAYIKSMATAKASTEEVNAALEGMRNEAANANDALNRSAQATSSFREASRGAMAYRAIGMDVRALGYAAGMMGVPGAAEAAGLSYAVTASVRALERLPAAFEVVAAKIGLTVTQLGALGIGAGALVGGLVLLKNAIDKNKRAAEEYRKELEQRLALEETRVAKIAAATSEEVTGYIEEEKQRRAGARALVQRYEAEKEYAESLRRDWSELVRLSADPSISTDMLESIRRAMGDMFPLQIGDETIRNIDELEKHIEALGNRAEYNRDQIDDSTAALQQYQEALTSGATAANDARVADERLAEQRRAISAAAVSDIQRQAQLEMDVRRKAATYSVEQTRQEIEEVGSALTAADDQIRNLQAALMRGELTLQDYREQVLAVNKEQDFLNRQLEALRTVIMRSAQAHDDAEDIERTRKEAAEGFTRASEEALSIEQRRTALLDEYAAREEQIAYRRQVDDVREAEDWARRQMKARAQLNDSLIEIDRKALEERDQILEKLSEADTGLDESALKLLIDYQKREKRATVDYWRDMAKINRDERRSVLEAAAGLDARAVWEAQRAAEDQRKERTEQFEEEKAERTEDYKERLRELEDQRDEKKQAALKELRDLEEKHRKERAARIADFNKQMAEEALERAIRQRRLKEDRDYEDALRQQQFQNELAAINQLSFAAQALLDKTRALAQAAGGVGTAAYTDELKAKSGKYVTYAGQKIRVDMYDPAQAGGMSAAQWYLWKQRYGFQRGGYPPLGKPVMVGENGPEWVQFMWPARILPNGRYPVQPPQYSRTIGDIHIVVNEAFDAQRTAKAVRQELMAVLTA